MIVAMDIMINPSVTSYEMICATARMAPISGYFEFDDQPDHRIVYVNMPDMAMMNSRARFMLVSGNGMGIGAQVVNAKVNAMIGERVNRIGEESVGFVGSFRMSLIPSAIGCSRPNGPTRFGPFRSCMCPSSFRSSRVRKATAIRMEMMYSSGLAMLSRMLVIIKAGCVLNWPFLGLGLLMVVY